MKTLTKSKFILCIFLSLSIITACDKGDPGTSYTISKTVFLNPDFDGTVINSSPREVVGYFDGSQGPDIRMGWNAKGEGMRSFISFDLNPILPVSGEELLIKRAILKVYEANTNLHPFNGDGKNRTVQVSIVECNTLDGTDFDLSPLASCGTIASWGYNVLEEHALNVTTALSDYYNSDQDNIQQAQFRLQFTNDENLTDPSHSDLSASMWNIFAEEKNNEYIPVLEIDYQITKK